MDIENCFTENEEEGVLQYGSFKYYYNFHPADYRIQMLPANVWLPNKTSTTEPYLVLDLGSNTGELTQKLWQYISEHTDDRPVYILGIELDNDLLRRAQELNKLSPQVQYVCQNIMSMEDDTDYILRFLSIHKKTHFDAVCCFSLTMWIHLNDGDSGLQKLLQRLSDWGKLIVIEPQPWKCYQKAQRRMLRTGRYFKLFKELAWRSDVELKIDNYCQSELKLKKLCQTPKSNWNRRIYIYRNLSL